MLLRFLIAALERHRVASKSPGLSRLFATLTVAAALVSACGGSDLTEDTASTHQQGAAEDLSEPAAGTESNMRLHIAAAKTDAGWQISLIGVAPNEISSMRLEDGRDLLEIIQTGVLGGHGELSIETAGFSFASSNDDNSPTTGKIYLATASRTFEVDLDVVQLGETAGNARVFAAAVRQTCAPKLNPIVLPSANRISATCRFGEKCGASWDGRHTGIDFAGAGKVYAIADGEVVRYFRNGEDDHGLGETVVIAHKTGCSSPAYVYSTYSHLGSVRSTIKVGRIVKAGTLLGEAGGTGFGQKNRWETHLHFELKLSPVLGNPFGVGRANEDSCRGYNAKPGVCFGYTLLDPTNYGYLRPDAWLNGAKAPI